jgi:hypothetical protein
MRESSITAALKQTQGRQGAEPCKIALIIGEVSI